jgi:hypothetical protein
MGVIAEEGGEGAWRRAGGLDAEPAAPTDDLHAAARLRSDQSDHAFVLA